MTISRTNSSLSISVHFEDTTEKTERNLFQRFFDCLSDCFSSRTNNLSSRNIAPLQERLLPESSSSQSSSESSSSQSSSESSSSQSSSESSSSQSSSEPSSSQSSSKVSPAKLSEQDHHDYTTAVSSVIAFFKAEHFSIKSDIDTASGKVNTVFSSTKQSSDKTKQEAVKKHRDTKAQTSSLCLCAFVSLCF